MNQMNTLKCFFLNQHIKSFHWKCWVVSAFCNNNWERPTEACNNMWCREISFLFLVRARSFKLVSGVFHYWSSPSTKIVCTQGWLFASPFFTLIKISINIVSFSKCVYVYWSYYWEGKFIQFLSSNDENAKSLLITGNFVSCSSELMPIF